MWWGVWSVAKTRPLNTNLTCETLWTGVRSGLLISILEKLNLFHVIGLLTHFLLVLKWMDLLLKENHFLRCSRIVFFYELNWGSYAASFISKKIGALFLPPKFFSSEVALFLHKSTIWPCLDYFCHVKAGNPSWKQVYRAVGLSFVVFTWGPGSSVKCISQLKSFLEVLFW